MVYLVIFDLAIRVDCYLLLNAQLVFSGENVNQ